MRVPWEPSRTSGLLRAVTAALSHRPQFCLGTPTCRPAVEAFITRPVADHQRATFSTRGGVFLQAKRKTLFRCRGDRPVAPTLRSTVGQQAWEEWLGGTVLRNFHDPHTCPVFLIEEL